MSEYVETLLTLLLLLTGLSPVLSPCQKDYLLRAWRLHHSPLAACKNKPEIFVITNFLFIYFRIKQFQNKQPVSGFRIRIRINLSCWIRIRILIADPDPDPGGKKWPKKIEKRTEFSSFEVFDVHFWGLKASPVAWESFMEPRDK